MDGSTNPENTLPPAIAKTNLDEPISSLSLEAQYATFGNTLARFDHLIPDKELTQWSSKETGGRRIDHQKEFDSVTVLPRVRSSLLARFPSETDQAQVVSAAARLFGSVADLIVPRKNPDFPHDSVSMGELDKYLVGFPDIMITRLGGSTTAEEMSQIMEIASNFLDREREVRIERPDVIDLDQDNFILSFAASIAFERIPEALVNAGPNRQAVFEKLKSIAARKIDSVYRFDSAIKYYSQYSELPADMQKRVTGLVRDMEVSFDPNSRNPFDKEDRLPWVDLRDMGNENRVPTWDDLVKIVKSTEEDDKEYGIAIMGQKDSNVPTLEYMRGAQHSVFNGAHRRPSGVTVFFHSHPVRATGREAFSAVVSPGDLTASMMQDYGGGYFNLATLTGVTFHLGATRGEDLSAHFEHNKMPHFAYRIESGKSKGEFFAAGESLERRTEILQGMYDSSEPFVYTVSDTNIGDKKYFLHVPWRQLDLSIDLNDLTHGNGLPELMKTVDVGVDLPKHKNLLEAIEGADKLTSQLLKAKRI